MTPAGTHARAQLYRRSMSADEAALFEHLLLDPEYDNLRKEIALTRVLIHRCTEAIMSGTEWRVPLQVMPALLDKLIKMIVRMKPDQARAILTDDTEERLQKMIAEAEAERRLELEKTRSVN